VSTQDNKGKPKGKTPLFCARIDPRLAALLRERAARNRRQPAKELELILIEALDVVVDAGQGRG
jgi:hypothetical protein